jgi:hypothetical protein
VLFVKRPKYHDRPANPGKERLLGKVTSNELLTLTSTGESVGSCKGRELRENELMREESVAEGRGVVFFNQWLHVCSWQERRG